MLFKVYETQKPSQFLFVIPPLKDEEFEAIRKLVYKKSGIFLNEEKRDLVRNRLGKILRRKQISSFKDYYKLVIKDPTGQELIQLLDAISTNFTHFFRENQHFEFLKNTVILNCSQNKRIKIWSAGCSSGEEPYSIAITLLEAIKDIETWSVKILATDISTRVLEKAIRGVYQEEQLSTLPKVTLHKYFLRGKGLWAGYYQVRPEVKKMVEFKRLNLLEPFPFKTLFDVIFCRNVMIYFDRPTKENLITRFSQALVPGGYLFIGHSESLMGLKHRFKYIKPAIYQKV